MIPDIIGAIYKPTGNTLTDADGFEYPEMQAIEGFHVNFKREVPELSEYLCDPQPSTPLIRVYARDEPPVCYRFPNEATFREYFPEPEH